MHANKAAMFINLGLIALACVICVVTKSCWGICALIFMASTSTDDEEDNE